MALNYNKLWKLLIDKGLNKMELCKMTGMSQSTMAKLSKGENVNTEVLERICKALNCDISDIVETKKDA
jgi:Predicted transcriptional regulator